MNRPLRHTRSLTVTAQVGRDVRPRLAALLSLRSFFSFGAGVHSPTTLAARARTLGFADVGLMDARSVSGAVELHRAARVHELGAVIGAVVPVTFGPASSQGSPPEVFPIGLIAADREGYTHLNELLTTLHLGKQPALGLHDLAAHSAGLFCLSGDREGFPTQLFARRRLHDVQSYLRALRGVYRDRLFVQIYHDRAPGDGRRRDYLRALARDQGIALVAAPDARLVEPQDFPLLDALVCARLGIDVTTPDPRRPRNDGATLLSPEAYGRLMPFPDALANAGRIARECRFELLPERLTPPGGRLPAGLDAGRYLESVAYAALTRIYPPERWRAAQDRLAYELEVVQDLGLAGFFLTAYEVAQYCEAQGILAAGRGSAAASVLCRLLGVTRIDPLGHDLMFERFLYQGKRTMPDVDFDISSARRHEVIAWVEHRWGESAEAMVGARLTYRLPSAVQDLGRALGLPPETRDRLSRALGRDYRHLRPHRAREASVVFDEVLGDAPVRHQLVDLMERMEPGLVRQLNPHSGGVVISDAPLSRYSAQLRSSGGLKMLAFDKDDVEELGLIKLDLLGLRMLSVLERAREDVLRLTGQWLDFASLPDEPAVWREIARGDTMGLFQIESPGQVRLSTQLRPRDMTQLAHQVALFRPGPLQSSTVHPYVRRARGEEPVPTLPAPLGTVLGSTQGVILFQEQILRILAVVCGLDWAEAEAVRKRLATSEDDAEMDALRARFVEAAMTHSGWSEHDARTWFEACAVFRGYGFAESHAWAFAQHTYASAWVRHHHPAAYWAAVLTEQPGMWSPRTLASEARRFGVRLLPVDVNRSGVRHHADARHAIRLPLTAVEGVSEEVAREVVLARHADGRFADLDDFYHRLNLKRDVLETLALAGAFDSLMTSAAPQEARRTAMFRLGVLAGASPPGRRALLVPAVDTPDLPLLTDVECLRLDVATKGLSEAGRHPMDLWRTRLRDLGCVTPGELKHGTTARVAGLVVARQKPPTAKGVAFYVLEDHHWRAQVVIGPELWEAHRQLLRDAQALIVEGRVDVQGHARTVRAERIAELDTSVPVDEDDRT